MNVDEAMAIADNYRIWLSGGRVEMNSSEIVAIALAAEVERLRIELSTIKNNNEKLLKLVKAVKVSEFDGISLKDIDGKNWFDVLHSYIAN